MARKETRSNERDRYAESGVYSERKVKKPWQAWLGGSPVLVISVLIHVLFLALALFFVVQRIHEKRKQNFTEVSVSVPAQKLERKVQLTKMNQAQSSPEVTQRIVTNDLSLINLPAVNLPSDNPGEGSAKMGAAAIGGAGDKTGAGGGGMPIDVDVSMLANVFGIANGEGLGLSGHFYDLKQTPARAPTGMDVNKYATVVAEFMNTGWRSNFFSNYFVGPKPLYAPQIFMPYMVADNGPKAFEVDNVVQPKLWVVLYHGKVTAQKAGTYRFVGFGDDVCEVALNKRTVFDGSWRDVMAKTINHPPTGTYTYTYKCDLPGRGTFTQPFLCGDWINASEGQTFDIDILVGERPGGYCGFWLLLEEKDHAYQKTADGSPILPIFRMSDTQMKPTPIGCPVHAPNSDLTWTISSDTDN